MRAKLALPIGISAAAALAAQVEGSLFALWAAGRTPDCTAASPVAACSLSGTIAFIAGTFFAVETLAAVLVGLVLLRNGKRLGAGIAVAALALALTIEHLWLLGPSA